MRRSRGQRGRGCVHARVHARTGRAGDRAAPACGHPAVRRRLPGFVSGILAAVLTLALGACGGGEGPLPQQQIRETVFGLGSPVVRTVAGDTVHLSEAVAEFYRERGYAPVWTKGENVLAGADALLEALGRAERDGLDPGRYRHGTALELRQRFEETESDIDDPAEQRLLGDLDMILTEGFTRYADDLAMGTIDPEAADLEWTIERGESPGTQPIEAMLNGAEVESVIAALRPMTPFYDRLLNALAEYRQKQEAGGWPAVGELPKLEPGDSGPAVRRLRARLAQSTDTLEQRLASGGADRPELYDPLLALAVERFQKRNGVAPDGIIGPETRRALNIPVEDRIAMLRTNLDRWRWLPRDLGSTFILVNVAGQELEVVHADTTAMAMSVVVGKVGHETPIFRDTLEHIVVNPYWNVPESIAEEEIWPVAERDPGYLARNNYEVVNRGGRRAIRQRPGPTNALGEVKFLFPNRHNVYLHDTPADHLFSQRERAFSHGCVRVERPRDLARLLFEIALDRDPDEYARFAARDTEQWLNVENPVPVYILYFTAWATPEGEVHFYPDIYGRDERLEGQVRTALRK